MGPLVWMLCVIGTQDVGEVAHELRVGPSERTEVQITELAGGVERDALTTRLLFPVLPDADHRAEAGWSWGEATDAWGVTRPYQRYVPESVVSSDEPCALLVHMHGAVSRGEFSAGLGAVGYGGMLWVEQADAHGFALAFPLGRADCPWWSDEGVANVQAVIRDVKRCVPVDDDRIHGTGFSDGGSGSWYLAMCAPDPFAGFITMNGHPAVAAGAGTRALDLRNLALTSMVAAMTQDDSLYPAWAVLQHVSKAMEHGAKIRVASLPTGGHQPAYFEDEAERFVRFVLETKRDALPTTLRWWADRPGRVRWLEFTELGPGAHDVAEVSDVNVGSVPGRVRLGMQVDFEFLGDGVRITDVVDGGVAADMGLQAEDVLVAMDGEEVDGSLVFRERLGAKAFGDAITVEVMRGGQRVQASGRIPPFTSRPVYRRGAARGWAEVALGETQVTIASRGVRSLRLHLSPGMLASDEVAVEWNGHTFSASPDARSLTDLMRDAARMADWSRVSDRVLDLTLDAIEEASPKTRDGVKFLTAHSDLWFAGQPSAQALEAFAQDGVRSVLSTRGLGEIDWDEGALAEAAGMSFHQIPMGKPLNEITDEMVSAFDAFMTSAERPALLHCGSSNRVAGLWAVWLVEHQGVERSRALELGAKSGMRSVRALVERRLDATGDE